MIIMLLLNLHKFVLFFMIHTKGSPTTDNQITEIKLQIMFYTGNAVL